MLQVALRLNTIVFLVLFIEELLKLGLKMNDDKVLLEEDDK